jgi:hypothetical protein
MQIQSSGAGSASGYSAVQPGGRRPSESAAQGGQQDGAVQASGGNAGGSGNQPVQDPGATRGRIVNITA